MGLCSCPGPPLFAGVTITYGFHYIHFESDSQDDVNSRVELEKNVILRSPRSGRLEGRRALIPAGARTPDRGAGPAASQHRGMTPLLLLGVGRPPQPDFRDQRLDRAAGKAERGFVDETAVADLVIGRAD